MSLLATLAAAYTQQVPDDYAGDGFQMLNV